MSPCDENATCENFAGGFGCTCDAGYSGDGNTCVDIDECMSSPCDSNASCSNNDGMFFIIFRYSSFLTFFINFYKDLLHVPVTKATLDPDLIAMISMSAFKLHVIAMLHAQTTMVRYL